MTAWVIRGGATVSGVVRVPGDKSLGHRALMFGALGEGESLVRGLPNGEDVRSTRLLLEALGVPIDDVSEGSVRLQGVGLQGLCAQGKTLDCGNSGTTMRLMAGVLAGISGMDATLVGDDSLSSRPMMRVVGPLTQKGAQLRCLGESGRAPIHILGGSLVPSEHALTVASAQVKSALLLAGLTSGTETRVDEPGPSRDHTERMLRARGVSVDEENGALVLRPASRMKNLDVTVPGDISSAAFFLVLGALGAPQGLLLEGVGVNPTRTGVLDVLASMGAQIEERNGRDVGGEPVADLYVRATGLRGTHVGGEVVPRCIDELPVLAVAACLAKGETRIVDAAELRVKETDRIAATVSELQKMGVEIEGTEDGFVVQGEASLKGATVRSFGDHRIAMALAIAAVFAEGETHIEGVESAAISFPEFAAFLADVAPACDLRVV